MTITWADSALVTALSPIAPDRRLASVSILKEHNVYAGDYDSFEARRTNGGTWPRFHSHMTHQSRESSSRTQPVSARISADGRSAPAVRSQPSQRIVTTGA